MQTTRDIAETATQQSKHAAKVEKASARVEVVEASEDLARDVAHNRQRDAAVAEVLDQRQQVVAQHLEHHAHVAAVRARVLEGVEQAAAALVVVLVVRADLLQHLDLVARRLGVVLRGLLDLQRGQAVGVAVVCEPHGAEVAPAQLAEDNIAPIEELVADRYRMVPTCISICPCHDLLDEEDQAVAPESAGCSTTCDCRCACDPPARGWR